MDPYIYTNVPYPCMAEKALFLAKIFEMEILMDLQDLSSPESENLVILVSLSLCVCVSVISIAQKQTVVETSYLIFFLFGIVSHADAT